MVTWKALFVYRRSYQAGTNYEENTGLGQTPAQARTPPAQRCTPADGTYWAAEAASAGAGATTCAAASTGAAAAAGAATGLARDLWTAKPITPARMAAITTAITTVTTVWSLLSGADMQNTPVEKASGDCRRSPGPIPCCQGPAHDPAQAGDSMQFLYCSHDLYCRSP